MRLFQPYAASMSCHFSSSPHGFMRRAQPI
jgi:hypothetical protein